MALVYLTYIGIILLVGIICAAISNRINIPNMLLLLVAGIILGSIDYKGGALISFPSAFLVGISIFAIAMIVFDASALFKFKEIDAFSLKALRLSGIFLLLNLIFTSIALMLIFKIKSILLALIFSSLVSGTSPSVILSIFKKSTNKVINHLEIESIINTPLTVLLPFMFVDAMMSIEVQSLMSHFIDQIGPLLLQFVAGLGTGVFVGLIAFKIMAYWYSKKLSPLFLITMALLTYTIAENFKGNGVLAVTVLGLFYGNLYIKNKVKLWEFSDVLANSLQILVFVLVGLVTNIDFSFSFIAGSLGLFAIYLAIRYASVHLSFKEFNLKEKMFMVLNAQKGIVVAVVVFALSVFPIEGLDLILKVALAFMLYSIILSTIIVKFSDWFLEKQVT